MRYPMLKFILNEASPQAIFRLTHKEIIWWKIYKSRTKKNTDFMLYCIIKHIVLNKEFARNEQMLHSYNIFNSYQLQ